MDEVRQIRQAAIARVQARRLEQKPMRAGENIVPARDFRRAETDSEWLDDRIARTPHIGAWTAVLYEVAEAARDGAAAAVKAVRSARTLGAWDQWHLYRTLSSWKSDMRADVAPVVRAVLAEWENLELVMEEPVDEPVPVTPEAKRPKVKYRSKWGQPAGMAV